MSFFNRLLKNKKGPAADLIAPPQPLPQRNELCWCDSGKKYKKCHLEEDQRQLARIREKELAGKACSPVFG